MTRPANRDQFTRALRLPKRPGNRDQFVRTLGFRTGRSRPSEGGISAPAKPPRGPLPLQGGAEAPIERA